MHFQLPFGEGMELLIVGHVAMRVTSKGGAAWDELPESGLCPSIYDQRMPTFQRGLFTQLGDLQMGPELGKRP